MTDYQPLIARAVEGLENNTGEARRSLYERARAALVTQLRSIDPPLSESDITRQRLALEDAIRRVEADAARRARAEAREARQAAPPPPPPPRPARPIEPPAEAKFTDDGSEPFRPASPQSARERLLGARAPQSSQSREGLRGFRDAVSGVHDLGGASAKAAQSARDTRDSYRPLSAGGAPLDEDTEVPALDDADGEFHADEAHGEFDAADEGYGHARSDDFDDHAPRNRRRARLRTCMTRSHGHRARYGLTAGWPSSSSH